MLNAESYYCLDATSRAVAMQQVDFKSQTRIQAYLVLKVAVRHHRGKIRTEVPEAAFVATRNQPVNPCRITSLLYCIQWLPVMGALTPAT
jgi:hypothetical protein